MADVPDPGGASIVNFARAPDDASGVPHVPQCVRPGGAMPMDEISWIEPAVDAGGTYADKNSAAAATNSVTSMPKAHQLQIERLVVLCKLHPAVRNVLYCCSKCGQCGHTKDRIKISTLCPQKTDNSTFTPVVLAGCPFASSAVSASMSTPSGILVRTAPT